jgi:hypothetical protein
VPTSGVVPKIELHVHLGRTIRARTLLAIARRGALCDEGTRRKIAAISEQTAWPGL